MTNTQFCRVIQLLTVRCNLQLNSNKVYYFLLDSQTNKEDYIKQIILGSHDKYNNTMLHSFARHCNPHILIKLLTKYDLFSESNTLCNTKNSTILDVLVSGNYPAFNSVKYENFKHKIDSARLLSTKNMYINTKKDQEIPFLDNDYKPKTSKCKTYATKLTNKYNDSILNNICVWCNYTKDITFN